jgi:ankyrin repeat protein
MLKYDPADFYTGPALKMAEAVRRQDYVTLRALAVGHPNAIDSTGQKGLPLLAWTMGHDDPAAAEILLRAGARPDVTFPFGDWKMSLISLAASMENPGFIALLLAYRANPAGVPDTEPPLFSAVKADRYDRIETLLNAGADINQQDSVGKTMILMMAFTGDYPQVLAFVKRGADPRIPMHNGTTLEGVISRFPAQPGTPEHAAQTELVTRLRATSR